MVLLGRSEASVQFWLLAVCTSGRLAALVLRLTFPMGIDAVLAKRLHALALIVPNQSLAQFVKREDFLGS